VTHTSYQKLGKHDFRGIPKEKSNSPGIFGNVYGIYTNTLNIIFCYVHTTYKEKDFT
jgi:hypothetical protein